MGRAELFLRVPFCFRCHSSQPLGARYLARAEALASKPGRGLKPCHEGHFLPAARQRAWGPQQSLILALGLGSSCAPPGRGASRPGRQKGLMKISSTVQALQFYVSLSEKVYWQRCNVIEIGAAFASIYIAAAVCIDYFQ